MPSQSIRRIINSEQLTLAVAGIVFILLRVAGLLKYNELDDQDSIGLISLAESFRSFDLQAIADLSPTALPLYPMAIAVFSIFTDDLELAARLVSLASSVAAAAAIYLLARRLAGHWAGIISIFLLALNPYLIRFSYSVVTEPLYVAIYSWALYIFVANLRSPGIRNGVLLGVLAGLGYYARSESILLFLALPFVLAAFGAIVRKPSTMSGVGKFAIAYLCVFAVLAVPRIWHVSSKMNAFSIDGRTAWQTVLKTNDGRDYQEKLFGLDYDPATENIEYLMAHPEQLKQLASTQPAGNRIVTYARTAVFNLEKLHVDQIARLVGIPVFAFAVIGFLALLKSAHLAESGVILVIAALSLAAPLVAGVELDHIALLVPPLVLLAGIGLHDAINSIKNAVPNTFKLPALLASSLLLISVSPYAINMARLYLKPDDANKWYNLEAIKEPISVIESATAGNDDKPRIMESHSYIAYYAGGIGYTPPWTNLDGLLYYMQAHRIDFFYLDHYLVNHPFAAEVDSPEWNAAFTQIYAGADSAGNPQRVFSFNR